MKLAAPPFATLPLAPHMLLVLYTAVSAVLWTVVPALVHLSPPIDVVESALWGPEWVIGTYKHPALPAWVIESARRLGGGSVWPVYLASQLFVAATTWLTYLIGRGLMDAPRGVAAALLLAGLESMSWASPNFNHNIAQLPFWLAAIWLAWLSVETRSLGAWAALGAVAAAGLYAKFSLAVLLVVIALWLVADAKARRTLTTPGPWLALAVFVAVSAPLASWLIAVDLEPLRYASTRAGESALSMIAFLPRVALAALPIVATMALAGLFGRAKISDPPSRLPDQRTWIFLLATALGPLALVLLGAIVGGTGVRGSWGAPMLAMLAVLGVALTASRVTEVAVQRLAVVAGVLAVAIPLGYAGVVTTLLRPESRPSRVNWPQAAIATELRAAWGRETKAPLRIVAGDAWIAGLAGLTADRPSILTDGDMKLSPWITPERLAREGVLVVWETALRGKPPGLDALIAGRSPQTLAFNWPRARKAADLVVHYVIVPPAER